MGPGPKGLEEETEALSSLQFPAIETPPKGLYADAMFFFAISASEGEG